MVDATVGAGVSLQSVWNYCQTRSIQVRRLVDRSIPPADIADIAPTARQHIGEPYSVLQVIVSKHFPGAVQAPDTLYCSTMVGLVIAEAESSNYSSLMPSVAAIVRSCLAWLDRYSKCCACVRWLPSVAKSSRSLPAGRSVP